MKVKNFLKRNCNPFTIIAFCILAVYSLMLVSILGWALIKSFQTESDFILQGASVSAMPKEWSLANYVKAFSKIYYKLPMSKGGRTVYFGEMLGNSLLYSLGCAIIATLVPCVVAYLTVRCDFWFNKIINGMFYFQLLVPIVGSLPSSIQIMNTLGLMDTWIGVYMMKFHFMGMYFLIFQGTFRSLSKEYSEAAIIDGANHYKIMFGIEFSLVKTVIMIVFVMEFISFWNDYQTPMIYLSKYPTASYGMYKFNSVNSSDFDYVIYKVAGFMILIIPIFVLFMIFKDKMMGNLTVGGLKG